MDDVSIVNEILRIFQQATVPWANALLPFARTLFFGLLTIQFLWLALGWILTEGAPAIVIAMVRFILTSGIAIALMENGPEWLTAMYDSIKQLNIFLGGPPLDPSATFALGLEISAPVFNSISHFGYGDLVTVGWIAIAAGLAMVIAFTVLAGQLLVTLIKSYLLIASAPWFMAFAGSNWTRGIAERFVNSALGILSQLFLIVLLIAVAREVKERLVAMITLALSAPGAAGAPTWKVYLIILGVSIMLIFLFRELATLAYSIAGSVTLRWDDLWQTVRAGGRMTTSAGSMAQRGVSTASGAVAWGTTALHNALNAHREPAREGSASSGSRSGGDEGRSSGGGSSGPRQRQHITSSENSGREAVQPPPPTGTPHGGNPGPGSPSPSTGGAAVKPPPPNHFMTTTGSFGKDYDAPEMPPRRTS